MLLTMPISLMKCELTQTYFGFQIRLFRKTGLIIGLVSNRDAGD